MPTFLDRNSLARNWRGGTAAFKWADIMIWKPAFFGVKPALIPKGGLIAMGAKGDPNAFIPTPQPVHYRPMFGAFGGAIAKTSLTFVSQAGLNAGMGDRVEIGVLAARKQQLGRKHRAARIRRNLAGGGA